jgi:hypothetical protein
LAVSIFALSTRNILIRYDSMVLLDIPTVDDIVGSFYPIGRPSVLTTESTLNNIHTYLDQLDIDYALKLAHNENTTKKPNRKSNDNCNNNAAMITPHHTVIEIKEVTIPD